jgi:hypothetical protein
MPGAGTTLGLIASALSVPVVAFFEESMEQSGQSQGTLMEGGKKPGYKKELSNLLKGLPDQVIEHYLTLMKLEKELLQRDKN